MNHTDQHVLEKIKQGDVSSYRNIFQQYYVILVGFAERYVEDMEIAEDLVQDLFAKIWETRRTLSISSNIKSYLYQSVKNQCLNYIKHDQVKKKYEEHAKHVDTDQFFHDSIEAEELSGFIHQAIQNLPPKCREIFELSRMEGKNHDEISELLSISKKTINNQLWKALKLIKEHLSTNEVAIFFHLLFKRIR